MHAAWSATRPPLTHTAPRGFRVFSCAGHLALPPFFARAPRMR